MDLHLAQGGLGRYCLAMRLLLLFISMGLAFAQAPGNDRRNTDVPNTDTHFPAPPERTLAEWNARRDSLREQVLFAAGLAPAFEKTDLRAQVFGELKRDGYSVSKVLLETLPGYYLGGNLFRPEGAGPFPVVLKPHGHWTYGRLENQPLNSTQTLAVNLALRGMVVFAYDMAGYNDTLQTPHRFSGKAEELWGFGPLPLQTWNSVRAVDFVESLPYVDKSRIGATGASGGGTQTFILSAVDERIAAAAPVNMVSAIMQGGCVCENAPGLRVGASNVEIAALTAPRPMLLVAATGDWTKNVPREEYPAIRQIYDLFGKSELVSSEQFDAPHNYNQESREAVYRFLSRNLLGKGEDGAEKKAAIEQPPDLLALYGRPLPANALDYDGVFAYWKEASRRRAAGLAPDEKRSLLRLSIKASRPDSVRHALTGDRVVLTRPESGDRIPGRWLPGKGTPVLVVHPGGAAEALKAEPALTARREGRPVLAIDAFQTGEATASRDRSHKHFLTFNLTDDANRVQDVLTAVAFLQGQTQGPVEVTGLQDGAIWALFAAALSPDGFVLRDGGLKFGGTDAEFLERFFVPGIQRAGGLEAALELTARIRRGGTN